MPPQTKMKVSALPAEKEEKKPTLAVVGSKIPAELSQQLRKLAHDLSNSMETVMQASYLLARRQVEIQQPNVIRAQLERVAPSIQVVGPCCVDAARSVRLWLVDHQARQRGLGTVESGICRQRSDPFTKGRQVLAANCLFHEIGNDPAIVELHSRAVRVENAYDASVHFVIAPVSHGHRFGEAFSFVVNRTRADWIHVSPVSFLLRMLQRVAVALGGGRDEILRPVLVGHIECVKGSKGAHF